MSDDQDQKAKLNFASNVDYYDSTDFALLSAEVDNDAWIGNGDAMATLALLRGDGSVEQVYLPVTVDNGPVSRGAKVTFPVENATRQIHGETQISLIDLSGAEAGGTDQWTVFYAPIRNPFDE
jgi:hypothetical protein